MNIRVLSILLVGTLALVACAEAPMPSTLRQSPRCPLTLGAEDVVSIRVFGEDDMSGDYEADTQGNLRFPFVGTININGKTNTSLADDIASALRDGEFILEPQVTAVIKEHNSAKIVVDGQVARPKTMPFQTGMTLLWAISEAGGMTPMANQREVSLTRNTGDGTNTMTVPVRAIRDGREPDVPLCPGDTIFVNQSVL